MQEIFKDIEEFEGLYQVSNSGKVKSLERLDTMGRRVRERLLKQGMDKDGYHLVRLCKNGIFSTKKVHRLVAQAFIPNPENKLTVNHQDLDKDNNYDWNLEWATRYENNFHASKHGLIWKKGEKHPRAKLTAKEVKNIRELVKKENTSYAEIGRFFGVHGDTIGDIVNRRTWKHI